VSLRINGQRDIKAVINATVEGGCDQKGIFEQGERWDSRESDARELQIEPGLLEYFLTGRGSHQSGSLQSAEETT